MFVVTGRSTSLSMSMKVIAWTHDGHEIYIIIILYRLEYTINIIGLLAVYDIFTLVVASQAYAITIKIITHKI